ncbi:MAG TPA: DJ-1/PfpI family protein [Betaproteobacteria bacterium]|nr:DJ-1/PfpI family protein [Betaproteobacteria bacterium]
MAKRLGIYIFDDAEVIDWSAPLGVFAVARRMDPELDAFLIGDTLRTVQATANLSVTPRYALDHKPSMDAFLIPGGIGSRAEMHNDRLLAFVQSQPRETLLVSVCTGSWIYGKAGLLDGVKATSRKNGDPSETIVPLERLAHIAPHCQIDRHRIVDNGRIITGGGITSGIEMGLHLLKRFGQDDAFIDNVAHVMEYEKQWALTKPDCLIVP